MNTLYHFPHQGIDGAWHAVYRLPGCETLNSIGDAASLKSAQRIADEANGLTGAQSLQRERVRSAGRSPSTTWGSNRGLMQ